MQQQPIGSDQHYLEEHEQVEHVAGQKGAVDTEQLELEQRVEVPPALVPAIDGVERRRTARERRQASASSPTAGRAPARCRTAPASRRADRNAARRRSPARTARWRARAAPPSRRPISAAAASDRSAPRAAETPRSAPAIRSAGRSDCSSDAPRRPAARRGGADRHQAPARLRDRPGRSRFRESRAARSRRSARSCRTRSRSRSGPAPAAAGRYSAVTPERRSAGGR